MTFEKAHINCTLCYEIGQRLSCVHKLDVNRFDLIEYRRQITAEYQAKMAAIDVLLGKTKSVSIVTRRSRGTFADTVRECVADASSQFTVDDLMPSVQAARSGEKVRRWDVLHALRRMVLAGDITIVNRRANGKPQRYGKVNFTGSNDRAGSERKIDAAIKTAPSDAAT